MPATAKVQIPGVEPLSAAAFLSEVNAEQFTHGRQLSAWCGLVPRQHSSGGKNTLSSMTKNGDHDLRTLIIPGARSVIHWAHRRDDALANKLTQIVWRSLTESTDFIMSKAFAMN